MPPEQFLDELRTLLDNPAVSDPDLLIYIKRAQREVTRANYSADMYIQQVLDTACQYLAADMKFPVATSASIGGFGGSFVASDPEQWKKRIKARRVASLMSVVTGRT